jgi:hypothetical protein
MACVCSTTSSGSFLRQNLGLAGGSHGGTIVAKVVVARERLRQVLAQVEGLEAPGAALPIAGCHGDERSSRVERA